MHATYLSPANFFPSVHFLSAAMRWALMVFAGAGGGFCVSTCADACDSKRRRARAYGKCEESSIYSTHDLISH